MFHHFEILSEKEREYKLFGAMGKQHTVRLKPHNSTDIDPATSDPQNSPTVSLTDPITHFTASLEKLFEYALQHVADTDKVGMTISNEENENDRPIGFSWRFKDQIAVDVIKSLFEKVVQSNARFNAMDKLVIEVHSVKMPVGFGLLKTNGRPFKELIRGKRSVVEVKAEENCLAHAIVLAIAKLKNHPNYESFRKVV
jgi:hypothetical protein